MALEGDEDTVMGEAGNPGAPAQFDGPSQPSITSPLLGQTFKLPLSRHPLNSQPLSASSKPEHEGGISPPKSLPKSVDSGDVIDDDEKNDSLVEENSDWSDGDAVARTGLPLASLPSGLCYDVQMRYHCEVRPTADVHPEDPRRIYYIYKELCRAGLVDDPESSRPLVSRPLKRINARNATEEEISLVHTPDHYAFVESTQGNDTPPLLAVTARKSPN